MKIIHFCQYKVKHSNGIQVAVWELAKHQAKLGHEVEIVSLGRAPSPEEVEVVAEHGIVLSGCAGGRPRLDVIASLRGKFAAEGVCVAHVHSVFIPWHSLLCKSLAKWGVTYFISPHGNLGPKELARKRLKKWLYLRAVEMGVLKRAAGVLCVSEPEVGIVNALVGRDTGKNLGNGVDPEQLPELERDWASGTKARGIFLGKSDILHKGFDRMFSVAKHIPGGVDFYVISHNQAELKTEFDALVASYADDEHVRVHPPVYGEDKVDALAQAHCYLHLPRWEVFGMAIVEAAMMGLPLILSEECDLAGEAEAAGAALVISDSGDEESTRMLAQLTRDMTALQSMGEKARAWAIGTYSSGTVASRSIAHYQSGVSSREQE